MIVNIELNCPVSVVVDTDTGAVKSVHVWYMALNTDTIVALHDDGRDHVPVTTDSPEAIAAVEIMRGDSEWPAWQFDA